MTVVLEKPLKKIYINKRGSKSHTNNKSINRSSINRLGRVNYHDNKLQWTNVITNTNITNPNKKRYTGISESNVTSSLASIVTQVPIYQYQH